MRTWRTAMCLIPLLWGCGTGSGEDQLAGSGELPAELGATPPAGWQPGDLCNPATDGWKPEAVPVSAEVQKQIDEGEPVAVSYPPGYELHPPPGVAECSPFGDGTRGTYQASCDADSDCPKGTACPQGYGFCVKPCARDADCQAPNTCLSGRLEIAFCGCANEGCSEEPVDMTQ